jgi:D-alanyl-D-alanine carboxypeptidase
MADELPDPDDGVEPAASLDDTVEAPSEPAPASLRPVLSGRAIGISVALAAIVGVIALDSSYIVNAARKRGGATPVAAPSSQVSFEEPSGSAEPPEVPAAAAAASSAEGELFQDGDESSPSVEPKKPKHDERAQRGTVRDAAARSCNTSSVDGLSRQIIGQARCIDPKAFVAVPRQPNLETKDNVFLYMDSSAREHLLRALRANKKKTMTVNSALRTVAQQYLLHRWASSKRCGIEIATPPGESNHESGLALDIAEAPSWKKALEAEQFHWLGAVDRVHYDYKGPDAASRTSVDVKAFQQLWNLNHPDDLLLENGQYGAETEERLEKSPARGFPTGPRCKH